MLPAPLRPERYTAVINPFLAPEFSAFFSWMLWGLCFVPLPISVNLSQWELELIFLIYLSQSTLWDSLSFPFPTKKERPLIFLWSAWCRGQGTFSWVSAMDISQKPSWRPLFSAKTQSWFRGVRQPQDCFFNLILFSSSFSLAQGKFRFPES